MYTIKITNYQFVFNIIITMHLAEAKLTYHNNNTLKIKSL